MDRFQPQYQFSPIKKQLRPLFVTEGESLLHWMLFLGTYCVTREALQIGYKTINFNFFSSQLARFGAVRKTGDLININESVSFTTVVQTIFFGRYVISWPSHGKQENWTEDDFSCQHSHQSLKTKMSWDKLLLLQQPRQTFLLLHKLFIFVVVKKIQSFPPLKLISTWSA